MRYLIHQGLRANISQVDRDLRTKTCCFISAYLPDKMQKENIEASKQLSIDLRALGYGHKNIKGVYKGVSETSMMITMPIVIIWKKFNRFVYFFYESINEKIQTRVCID